MPIIWVTYNFAEFRENLGSVRGCAPEQIYPAMNTVKRRWCFGILLCSVSIYKHRANKAAKVLATGLSDGGRPLWSPQCSCPYNELTAVIKSLFLSWRCTSSYQTRYGFLLSGAIWNPFILSCLCAGGSSDLPLAKPHFTLPTYDIGGKIWLSCPVRVALVTASCHPMVYFCRS